MIFRVALQAAASLLVLHLLVTAGYDFYATWRYEPNQENARGSRVLVTGASKGIGKALALMYCGFGASVAVHGRRKAALDEVVAECRKLGAPQAVAVVADMSRPGAGSLAVAQAAKALNGLDAVIVNHVSPYIFETQYSLMNRIGQGVVQQGLVTDLFSYIEAGNAAVPHLEKSRGSLVFVSTVAAQMPLPYCYAYCFAKRALNGHATAMRQELAMNQSSIHVGLAHLGSIDTQSARVLLKNLYTEKLDYEAVEPTALGIGAVVAGRIDELVVPAKLKPVLLLNKLAPSLFQNHLRQIAVVK